MIYFGALAATGVMQQFAWSYPTLTQAIFVLTLAHLAILFLMLPRLTPPVLRPDLILLLLDFEVSLGFTGYFSNFKEPLLLGGLAMLETFDARRTQHWVLGAVLESMGFARMGPDEPMREDELEVGPGLRPSCWRCSPARLGDALHRCWSFWRHRSASGGRRSG